HTKTTIVINDLDVERRRLGYFHNAAYYALEGEDFEKLFRVGAPADPTFMPLFAELVRKDALVRRSAEELRALARPYLKKHFARRPAHNPVARFGERFTKDLPAISDQGLAFYHAWAFATIRQVGAAFELLAEHTRWLGDGVVEAAPAFDAIVNGAKTLILKAARAVNGKRALDATAQFAEMASGWQRGMDVLGEKLS